MTEDGRARKQLLDADDSDDTVNLDLAVNSEYASRFEHNAQRARWDRLKEKNPRLAAKIEAKASGLPLGEEAEEDSDESSSDDEEEDDGDEALKENEQFLSVLTKIKQRDQVIYNREAKLFPEEESEEFEEEEEEEEVPAGKERPALLKDVLAQQALQGDEGTSDEEDTQRRTGPTYVEEQEQYRRAFLQEASKALAAEGGAEGDEFGGVLMKQKRSTAAEEAGAGVSQEEEGGKKTQALLDAYFGKDTQLAEDEKFLKQYILKKGWINQGTEPLLDAEDIEEDEEYLEQAERFEARYNHRFEEPGAGNVITYARSMEGIVRKKDDRRRAAREAKAARKAAEAAALEEEVKRRKAAKRRELDSRLAQIKEVSGADVANKMLAEMLGTEDFDMEEYDKAMAAAFDDSYYEAEDEKLDEKLPAGEGDSDAGDVSPLDVLPGVDDEEEGASPLPALEGDKAELTRLMDEYQKLDAEDYVGGMPTRFRYQQVPATTYGLNILEILAAPEKELNQVVGMKKLAPYREDGGIVRPNYSKLRDLQAEGAMERPRKKQRAEKECKGMRLDREQCQAGGGQEAAAGTAGREQVAEPRSTADAPVKLKRKNKVMSEAPAADKPAKAKKRKHKESAELDGQNGGDTVGQSKRQSEGHPAADGPGSSGPQQSTPGAAKAEKAAADQQQSRLASFAKPTLAKPGRKKGKDKSRERREVQHVLQPDGPQLTKAQRKNLWRQKRRALLKQGQH